MSDDHTIGHDDGPPIAAEYVLGVLGAEERRAVEARIASDMTFADEVAFWEERLTPLAASVKAVSAIGHRRKVWAGKSRPVAGEREPHPLTQGFASAAAWCRRSMPLAGLTAGTRPLTLRCERMGPPPANSARRSGTCHERERGAHLWAGGSSSSEVHGPACSLAALPAASVLPVHERAHARSAACGDSQCGLPRWAPPHAAHFHRGTIARPTAPDTGRKPC